MNLSREGAMELIGHEGIVLTRYKDSVGVWTIGVGHTRAAGPPDPETFLNELTLAQAFGLFENDVRKYVTDVNRALKVKVTQQQFDALVSFHFNTGAIGRATLVKKLNAGDVDGAAKGFMAWNQPPEVTGRRIKEQALFAVGKYSNGGMANVFPADARGVVNFKKPKRVDLRSALGIAKPPPPPDIAPVPVPKPKPPAHPAAKPTIIATVIAALVAAGAFVQDHLYIVAGAVAGAIAVAILIARRK